jgi:hypothetical protein
MKIDKRLTKLLKRSKSYEEFLECIQKFPRYYLAPEKLRWTKEDVRRYYYEHRI